MTRIHTYAVRYCKKWREHSGHDHLNKVYHESLTPYYPKIKPENTTCTYKSRALLSPTLLLVIKSTILLGPQITMSISHFTLDEPTNLEAYIFNPWIWESSWQWLQALRDFACLRSRERCCGCGRQCLHYEKLSESKCSWNVTTTYNIAQSNEGSIHSFCVCRLWFKVLCHIAS